MKINKITNGGVKLEKGDIELYRDDEVWGLEYGSLSIQLNGEVICLWFSGEMEKHKGIMRTSMVTSPRFNFHKWEYKTNED